MSVTAAVFSFLCTCYFEANYFFIISKICKLHLQLKMKLCHCPIDKKLIVHFLRGQQQIIKLFKLHLSVVVVKIFNIKDPGQPILQVFSFPLFFCFKMYHNLKQTNRKQHFRSIQQISCDQDFPQMSNSDVKLKCSCSLSVLWLTLLTSVKMSADIWLINVISNALQGWTQIRPSYN